MFGKDTSGLAPKPVVCPALGDDPAQQLVARLPFPVIVTDRDGVIRFLNAASREYLDELRLDASELLGSEFAEVGANRTIEIAITDPQGATRRIELRDIANESLGNHSCIITLKELPRAE